MAVIIGSARSDENGKAHGGRAGDQTGREVSTQPWYKHPKGWVVLRPKDPKKAAKIAQEMCIRDRLGATLTTDWDSLVTRIIPVGQDKEGKPLLLEGTTYIDSPHIGDYPVIRAQAVEYDVKVGQEGINNAAQARAKLTELAEARCV